MERTPILKPTDWLEWIRRPNSIPERGSNLATDSANVTLLMGTVQLEKNVCKKT
jgi:hypothetical protein